MSHSFDQQMLDVIAGLDSLDPPRLLLHSCCAPCSSSVLEQLARHFRVTVLYYNPNIYPREEYAFRKEEQQNFIRTFPFENPVDFKDCEYEPAQFYEAVKGLEQEPERGSRCSLCYRLRLRRTAREAAEGGYAFFATTLTLSPLKDAARLNRIGTEEEAVLRAELGERAPRWLPSDFKKRNGYLRSIEISKACGMYRQEYCGCEFSMGADISRGPSTPFDTLRHPSTPFDKLRDHSGTTQGPLRDRSGTAQGPLRDHSGTTQGPLRDRSGTGRG